MSSIRRKARLLDGICEEAVAILKDKPCTNAVFETLRKMKTMRQIEAAELLVNANNYSVAYVNAILAGTPQALSGAEPSRVPRRVPDDHRDHAGGSRQPRLIEARADDGDPDPTSAGTAGDAGRWAGSSAAVGMAANPFGAHQAGWSFRRPRGRLRGCVQSGRVGGRATPARPCKRGGSDVEQRRFQAESADGSAGSIKSMRRRDRRRRSCWVHHEGSLYSSTPASRSPSMKMSS
nr:plasmid partitioning protein RepB C-terminal domain-containing protein [Nitratireductor mangrovi]